MKKTKLTKQKYRASALVASLLILSAVLITALGMATISVKEMNVSLNSSKSSQAFQVADGGLEMALKKIKKDGWTTVKDFDGGGMTCNDGAISGNATNGDYKLTFKDSSGTLIDKCDNTDTIANIKSVGKCGETHRAIEVAVAAGTGGGLTCTSVSCHYWNNNSCSASCPAGYTLTGCSSIWEASNPNIQSADNYRGGAYPNGNACIGAGFSAGFGGGPGGPVAPTTVDGRAYAVCCK